MNFRVNRFFLLFLAAFSLNACNEEIIDFFEAIQDHGYRSIQPLGPKENAVEEVFLGGFVYDGLPVIISKKDDKTYQVKFLSVLLHKENVSVEAHTTYFGGVCFFNLDMGDYYCLIAAGINANQELEIRLLKDDLKVQVPMVQIKTWLSKHPLQTTITYTSNGEETTAEIYYSFILQKVPVTEALQLQKEKLELARRDLFENCNSYYSYEMLTAKYPNDVYRPLAMVALLDQCETIEEYREFISYFSGEDKMIEEAEVRIQYIIENERRAEYLALDAKHFVEIKRENTLDAYRAFFDTCYTIAYSDSANFYFRKLASSITREQVESEWNRGESLESFELLFYKIDYMTNTHDASWIIELSSEYALKYKSTEITQKVITYYDALAEMNVRGDDYLNLFLAKGFLVWSLNQIDETLLIFELRQSDIYQDGTVFKTKLKEQYEAYVVMGITFPDQKNTWKRIKKLKSD